MSYFNSTFTIDSAIGRKKGDRILFSVNAKEE